MPSTMSIREQWSKTRTQLKLWDLRLTGLNLF